MMELLVEKILKEKNIAYKLIELSDKAYTVHDVVAYSNGEVDPREICKTIILEGKKTGKKIAILLRGDDRLNFPAVKRVFGEEMKIANAEGVKESAGVDAGAVCPFILEVPLYVDKRALELDRINCGSGNHMYGLEFKSEDLKVGVQYQAAELTK